MRLLNRVYRKLWNCDHLPIYDRKKRRNCLKKELTFTVQILNLAFRDRSEVFSSSSSAEVLLMLFRAAKSSIGRIALLCSSALHCSLVCERPGSWYRRAVVIGDDVAVQGMPCSCAPDGRGAMVALVQFGRPPQTLGSIDEHAYSRCASRSKHLLFGPCLSGQWTALRSRWARIQLCGVAQRLHV